jgi:hypothetical protein
MLKTCAISDDTFMAMKNDIQDRRVCTRELGIYERDDKHAFMH